MFQSLNSFQKFQSGSHLWLIFFEPQRNLFKQINWRTGFLLNKPKGLKAISRPILLGTQNIFPNNSLLCLPFKEDKWLLDIYNSWKQMDKPSFRVFIPLNYKGDRFCKSWPSEDPSRNISYYEEALK